MRTVQRREGGEWRTPPPGRGPPLPAPQEGGGTSSLCVLGTAKAMPLRTGSGRYGRVVPISDQGDPAATTSTTAATLPTDDGGGLVSDAEPLSSAITPADNAPSTAPNHAWGSPPVARIAAATTVGSGTTMGTGTGTGTATDTDTDTAAAAAATATTTGTSCPTPVEEGEEKEAEEDGRDTHYVGFEGDRSRVVVIDKKATFARWFLGSAEASKRYDEAWAACQLTPITLVLSLVSTVGTVIAYTCFVRDKRLFFIPGIAGVGNWYNMLTSRSPRVLRILAKDFGEWGVWGVWAGVPM